MTKKLEKIYIKYLRKCQNGNKLLHYYYRYRLHKLSLKTQIQIPYTCNIGEGFHIVHLGRIIINPKSTIGKNFNVCTGVVIGQENRGTRKGYPTIGNNVFVGANAVIVGNIKIGDDVLIAPNSFVNVDVPSHSVVIGNPCKIHHKDNATEGYIG